MNNSNPLQRTHQFFSSLGKELKVRHRAVEILALLILLLPVLKPLLTTDFTCGYDNVFHLWRAVQVDALWSQGVFYSRWAPDMAQGFGFPLFVFTSPGPSMIASLIYRSGLTFPVAINITFMIGVVLGALLMYNLADDLFGSTAGLVAGVAYAYAPFQAYDVFNRGSLWESFAWVFPPLVLWGIDRWALRRQRAGLVWGVFGLALMVLSHHLFAFLFAPLFAVWVLASAYREHDWNVLWRGAVQGLLGMGLTAFFWLPPLLERQYVQTDRLLGTWVFEYQHNFISLKHLLALPRFADHLLINDWPEKALGFVPVIIALLAFTGFRKSTDKRKWAVGVLAVMAVVFAVLTLPVSRFVWDAVPLLRFVQFPWRFLGPAAFCIALLSGAACAAIARQFQKQAEIPWITFLLASLIISANFGWFLPKHCRAPEEISLQAMLQWEGITDTLGTTAKGEYLPVWVKQMPESAALLAAYNSGTDLNRINSATFSSGSIVSAAKFGAISDIVQINAADAFTVQWLRFYYPGWRVKVDGERVPVFPAPESGYLSFDVPAGNHSIEVDFTETPLRLAADGVSLATFIIFLAVLYFNQFHTIQVKINIPVRTFTYLVFVFALLGIFFFYAGREGSLWRYTRLQEDGTLRGIEHPLQVNFGNKAQLIGIDHLPSSIAGDRSPEMTLYWRAITPGNNDWQVGLSLVGPEGETAHNIGLRPARWSRTPPSLAEWSKEQYARMDLILDIPLGIPPGHYDLRLKLFDRNTLLPASILDAGGNPLGPDLRLGGVTITPPGKPYPLDTLGVPADVQPVQCGPLNLWLMEIDRTAAAPGDSVLLRWVWEAVEQTVDDFRVPLKLVNQERSVVWVWDQPITASWWPAHQWAAGDRWVGEMGLRLPGFLETGFFTIEAGPESCETAKSVSIEIIAPERVWSVPDAYAPVEVEFGARITLKGVLLDEKTVQSGEVLDLSLAWTALIEMEFPYRIFVHVTGEDGTILVQNDGEPAQWTRPTTGWAVNEIVIDQRPLTIPSDADAGFYTITTGVYNEDGTRLTLHDGGDTFTLGTVEIK